MTTAASAQIVTFRLGEDLFAADINEVERVLRYAEPTPVPNVPEWVQGVIEYRSRVVPVIDLRTRFGLPAKKVDGATRLMILTADGEWIAAVVDAVLEVVPITESQLAPPPALFGGLSAEFLRGILRRNDRLTIVLDVARLLSTKEQLAFDRTQRPELPELIVGEATRAAPVGTARGPELPRQPGGAPAKPGVGEAGDTLVITRSGEPLYNEPLEPPATNNDPPRPAAGNVPALPPPLPADGDGEDGGFGRSDG